MLLNTAGGAVYPHAEVASWLAQTGRAPPAVVALRDFERVVAQKR